MAVSKIYGVTAVQLYDPTEQESNRKSSSDFGLLVSGTEEYKTAARDMPMTAIKGRNGVLLQHGVSRWAPVELTMRFGFRADAAHFTEQNPNVQELFERVTEWLLGADTWRRLVIYTRGSTPTYYRNAICLGPIEWERRKRDFFADITFLCQPERYLFAGQTYIQCADRSYVVNRTPYPARPRIKIYGTGQILFASKNLYAITVADSYTGEYILLDCEQRTITNDQGGSADAYITYDSIGSWPEMAGGYGAMIIFQSDTITRVDVAPNYYEV